MDRSVSGMDKASTSRKYAEYQDNYQKENIRQFKLKVNKKTEPELFDWLEGKQNIQGYLKELVRKDMKENG